MNRTGSKRLETGRYLQRMRERFWRKVDRSDEDGCWVWTAYQRGSGYGKMWGMIQGKRGSYHAHRISWAVTHGDVPEGMFVLHRCDNPACVRPDHLFIGTNADNLHDMWAKGRGKAVASERAWRAHARATPEQVQAIRQGYAQGIRQCDLADQYGFSRTGIGHIVKRRSWSEIPDLPPLKGSILAVGHSSRIGRGKPIDDS